MSAVHNTNKGELPGQRRPRSLRSHRGSTLPTSVSSLLLDPSGPIRLQVQGILPESWRIRQGLCCG
jgi:hypothetical protein